MAIQAITRQDILRKVSELITILPEDKLQYLWEQIDDLGASLSNNHAHQPNHRSVTEAEILEFDVVPPPLDVRQIVRLPIRTSGPLPPVEMEISEPNQASDLEYSQAKNIRWWNLNYESMAHTPELYDKYVAVSNARVFTGESYEVAYKNAIANFSTSEPYIFFLKSPNDEN